MINYTRNLNLLILPMKILCCIYIDQCGGGKKVFPIVLGLPKIKKIKKEMKLSISLVYFKGNSVYPCSKERRGREQKESL